MIITYTTTENAFNDTKAITLQKILQVLNGGGGPGGGAPAAPSGLTVTIDPNHLEWTDNASDESSFDIAWNFERGAFNEAYDSAAANATSYDDGASGQELGYRVRARNGSGTSAWADHIANPPYNLAINTSTVAIRALAWNNGGGNPDLCIGIEIWRKVGAGSYSLIHTTAANEIEYDDTEDLSADEGETVFYKLAEVNSIGTSGFSVEASDILNPP